jgi:hypothetical protein
VIAFGTALFFLENPAILDDRFTFSWRILAHLAGANKKIKIA